MPSTATQAASPASKISHMDGSIKITPLIEAAYSVHFESEELVTTCVDCLNDKLRVTPLIISSVVNSASKRPMMTFNRARPLR